jgi:hypothetical protein
MTKQVLLLSSIGVLCMFLFYGMFKLFQNDKIYHNTIGTISQNYEHTGEWNDYTIKKVSKPYLDITNDNYLRWDASIFNCISKTMYSSDKESCYSVVKAAFFPLFPLLWKTTHASPIVISILNYLMFIISISLLVIFFLPNNNYLRITTLIALITLPNIIIYLIPYSESLFLLCTTIAVIGILKKKYSLYFLGILLMSMVRSATIFVLLAIIATEVFIFIQNKKTYPIISHILSKSLPFLIGYSIVLTIQRWTSGSWSSFFEAQTYWERKIQVINSISDWSTEGFGMSTFSIFFITIPSLAFLSYLTIKLISKKESLFNIDVKSKKNYLTLISTFYLSGILLFTLITSGGNIHGFYRLTMCSPFFYIATLILIAYFSKNKSKLGIILFCVSFLLLCLFLYNVDQGGDKFRFAFFGLFMLLISFFFLLNRQFLSVRYNTILLFCIVLLNTVWNTYMLNVFFSNGWIFT